MVTSRTDKNREGGEEEEEQKEKVKGCFTRKAQLETATHPMQLIQLTRKHSQFNSFILCINSQANVD